MSYHVSQTFYHEMGTITTSFPCVSQEEAERALRGLVSDAVSGCGCTVETQTPRYASLNLRGYEALELKIETYGE
jgi:hypothetical protein